MNLQLGIYEIFSTIIPGFIYLVALGELLLVLKIIPPAWRVPDTLSVIVSFGLLVLAYLMGIAFSSFGIIWYNIFKRKDQSVEALTAFKQRHKDHWVVNLEDKDWHILQAYIRSKNTELAREIERHLATSIMLRNVSFGILLIAAIKLLQYFLSGPSSSLFASLLLFIFSLLMLNQSVKFRRWYYDTILSTIVAYRLDLEKSIQPVIPFAKPPRAKSQKISSKSLGSG